MAIGKYDLPIIYAIDIFQEYLSVYINNINAQLSLVNTFSRKFFLSHKNRLLAFIFVHVIPHT
jgi:hypothetical protein